MRLTALQDPNVSKSERARFLPYLPHSLAPIVPLRVTRVEVDDHLVTDDALRAEACRVRPHVVQAWKRLTVDFELDDIDAQLRSIAFPPGSSDPVEHLLRIRCRETRLRRAVAMRRTGSSYRGTLTLTRDDCDNLVLIECLSARATRAAEPDPRLPSEEHTWIARSPRWIVEIDEGKGPAGGALDFCWVDFGQPTPAPPYRGEDCDHLRRCPDALSHVAIRPEGPLILLNKRHPAVVSLLQCKGTVGIDARLRDVLLGRVAAEAWRAILAAAVGEMAMDKEPTENVDEVAALGEEHWTTHILRHVEKHLGWTASEAMHKLGEPSGRNGHLFEASETLGRVGTETLRKLAEELRQP